MLMGNVDQILLRNNAGTITDGGIFVEKNFNNQFRIYLPPAQDFWERYGLSESLIISQNYITGNIDGTFSDQGHPQGHVILPHPDDVNFGTQRALLDNPDIFNTDARRVFIDNFDGLFATTDEGNFKQNYWDFNSPADRTRRTRTYSIRLERRSNLPVATFRSGANGGDGQPEILGNVSAAYLWVITPVLPAISM